MCWTSPAPGWLASAPPPASRCSWRRRSCRPAGNTRGLLRCGGAIRSDAMPDSVFTVTTHPRAAVWYPYRPSDRKSHAGCPLSRCTFFEDNDNLELHVAGRAARRRRRRCGLPLWAYSRGRRRRRGGGGGGGEVARRRGGEAARAGATGAAGDEESSGSRLGFEGQRYVTNAIIFVARLPFP